MPGTSREVFTVQKDRRNLLAPDFPEPPQMQSLRRLTDHPQDETAERMRDHSPHTKTRQLSQQRGRTTAPVCNKIEEGKHTHRSLTHRAATAMGPRPGPRSDKRSPCQLPRGPLRLLFHRKGFAGVQGTGDSRLG